ncbi:pilus assembly protein PilP [Hydrogenophaga crassostreae]|uniref:Pilus assembly protein PilP n=1 Tax=Hydrogenophaga crassostreae TaxID=1763535 RepID=A0A163CBS7_9BURK|nr:pilus assembly protein PilP [Hydrogenophaga crassostreae]AOW12121.1 pilus assembly protein PilP [Hydrogenophaga crassostreae]OAD41066.1 pilus assembly protein PilP [Hydrogenophaga crassostreae]
MKAKNAGLWLFLAIGLTQLQGCISDDQESLVTWMQQERESIKPNVKPIPEPTTFEPYQYLSESLLEPFSKEKLASILKSGQATTRQSALIEAELSRRQEPLEAFPLDTMSMVGTMQRKDGLIALVKVGALLYQVRSGQYLGQNYGRVIGIRENELQIREIAQDAAGEWIERPAALQLQEDTSK